MGIKYLTDEELESFFKVIEKDESKYNIRNKAIFKIGYYCALRASEVGLFEKDDFNKMADSLYCRRLKGSYNNSIKIIDKHILKSLKTYLTNPEPCPNLKYLFPSEKGNPISRKTLDKMMKKYCRAAGIADEKKWHFHTLRHTRAVQLADAGLDLKDLQWWLGHKDVKNTQIYFQYTVKQQEQLYNKLKKSEYYKKINRH